MKSVKLARTIFSNKKISLIQIPILIGMGSYISADYSSGFKDTKIYSNIEKPVICSFYVSIRRNKI